MIYTVRPVADVEAEWERWQRALESAKAELRLLKERMEARLPMAELQIFDAHLLLLEDPAILDEVRQGLQNKKVNAEAVVDGVMERYAAMLQTLEDGYLQQRAADIRDVKKRLLRHLTGIGGEAADNREADEPVILLAKDLTPSQTASLPTGVVKGFLTMSGGTSSHSAILARSLQIPAIVGAGADLLEVQDGDEILLDGCTGEYWVNPCEADRLLFLEKKKKYENRIKELEAFKTNPAVTKDGTRVDIACNIGHPKDVESVLAVGADGIGLFRTEFLFMDRPAFPTEEEQFWAYKEVLEKMDGKPVIIRTLDIGGDKPLPYFPIVEANPFLGYRAIRICLDRPELFRTQVRALYRASRFGRLKIMLPMIAAVEEVMEARALMEEARQQVQADPVPVGIMVETPAAAVMIDQLADFVDFFSIGSNDLIQYAMAADRMNRKVAHLADPLHPPVLRFIHAIIRSAHESGRPVAMCGEMAGDERAIPLLYAMGLDEFSMNAGQVPAAKKRFSDLTRQACRRLLDQVLQAKTRAEVEEAVQQALSGMENG